MKKILSILLALMCIISLSSCTRKGNASSGGFKIVTSFYPVYVTTLNLVDGAKDVELVNMTDAKTGCLHNYVMSSDDMKTMTSAKLFIASGLNMERFVGKVSLGIPGLELLESGEDVPHKIGEEEAENPHYWLDIDNVIAQTEKIRKTLCRLDPKNTDVYNKNAAEYTKKLNDLKAEATARCDNLAVRKMPVVYDTLDYFTSSLNIEEVKLLSETYANSPKEKKAAQIITKMKLDGIDTIFADDETKSDAAIKAVQKETKCNVVVLDALMSGEIDENTKDAYFTAYRKNFDTLEEILGKK